MKRTSRLAPPTLIVENLQTVGEKGVQYCRVRASDWSAVNTVRIEDGVAQCIACDSESCPHAIAALGVDGQRGSA